MSPPLTQVESTGLSLVIPLPTFALREKLTARKLNFDDIRGILICLALCLLAVTHPLAQWHSAVSRSAGWTAAGCRWACPDPRAAGPLPETTLLR